MRLVKLQNHNDEQSCWSSTRQAQSGKSSFGSGAGEQVVGKHTELSTCPGKSVVNHTNLTTEERPAHSRDKPVDHLLHKQTTQLTEDMHKCNRTSSLVFLLFVFSPLSQGFELRYGCVTAKFGILFWCSLSRLQVGRKTGRCRKKSYWFESQSWHSLIAWWQDNGRSLIKNVILIAELPYLLKKRGLYQQQECSYHLERLELANERPFLF